MRVALSGLYALFDTDGDGMVDLTVLTSSLSMLCGSDRGEKGAVAIAL